MMLLKLDYDRRLNAGVKKKQTNKQTKKTPNYLVLSRFNAKLR